MNQHFILTEYEFAPSPSLGICKLNPSLHAINMHDCPPYFQHCSVPKSSLLRFVDPLILTQTGR